MKMKKLVSAIAALAMSVSAFAGLASAEATVYYSNDYQAEGAAVDWSTSTGGRFTPTLMTDGDNTFLSVAQGERNNNGATLTSTSLNGVVAAGTDFTMEWDMKLSSSTNQTPAVFTIYDAANSAAMLSLTATGTWAINWNINNDTNKVVTLAGSNAGNGSQSIADVPWNHYKLTRSGANTYLTITDAAGAAVLEQSSIAKLSEAGGLGKMEFATKRYNANFAIDNIVVRAVEDSDLPTAESAEYTINYTLEGAVVSNVTGTNFVGETVTADAIVYDKDGTKYFITAEEVPSITLVSGENVLNVPVRAAEIYSYTVNSNIGTTIATGTVVEGEAAKIAYPRYINNEGTLYEKGVTDKEYRYNLTTTESNYVDTLEYSSTDITNVVYYSEAEFIEGVTLSTKGNIPVRSSNALAAYATEDVVLTTLQPGVYKVYGNVYSNSSGGATVSFALGDNKFDFVVTGSSNGTGLDSGEITISEAADLTFLTSGADGAALDYIYVVKTGEYEAPAPEKTMPVVTVEQFGDDFTTDSGNAARAFIGTFTVDEATNYSVTSVKWTVNDTASETSSFDTVITKGTVVTGLVVTAKDLSVIESVVAVAE